MLCVFVSILYLFIGTIIIPVFASNSGYSIGLESKDGIGKTVSVFILVNNIDIALDLESAEIPATGLAWFNFQAAPGDTIEVRLDTSDEAVIDNNYYYLINNGPDGSRTNIYDSSSDIFYPRNRCPDTATNGCTFKVDKLLNIVWGSDKVKVLVNGLGLNDFSGTELVFSANSGDEIVLNHYEKSGNEVSLSISTEDGLDDNIDDYVEWFVGYFGSAGMIPNPFSKVEINLPSNPNIVPAGSIVKIDLVSQVSGSMPHPETCLVQLKCEGHSAVEFNVAPNLQDQEITIPSDLFGVDCVLSVERPIEGFNTRELTVTQPVTISIEDGPFLVNSLVKINFESLATSSTPISLTRTCGSESHEYPTQFLVGPEIEVALPVDFVGSCTFNTIASGVFQESSSAPVLIKNGFAVELASEVIYDGLDYNLKVSTLIPPASVEHSLIDLELSCVGIGIVQRISNFELNKSTTLKSFAYIKQETECSWKTSGHDNVYIHLIFSIEMKLQKSPFAGKMTLMNSDNVSNWLKTMFINFQ